MAIEAERRWRGTPIPAGRNDLIYPDAKECGEVLKDITDRPRIRYAASYAGQGIKEAPLRCYLRASAASRLQAALDTLSSEWSFLIFDTLRPYGVQKSLYERFWGQLAAEHPEADEEQLKILIDDFVAYPRIDYVRPAPHSTGGAVDLTLCRNGQPVNMGTDFDDFTDAAQTDYLERLGERRMLTEKEREALENRRILYHAMTEAGFSNYRNEWWHYSYGDRAWGAQNGEMAFFSYIEAPNGENGCKARGAMV